MTNFTGTLYSLFQKLDYRDKENSGKKKLTGILFAYIFSNSILSYNFFISFDERSFVILTLTSNLFLLAFIVLNDFDGLFLSSRSYDVIKTLPVKIPQFFAAKFLSAVSFLMFFIVSASIPQVIFFYLYEYNVLKVVFYFLTITAFCYFAVGILVFIYVLALYYFKNKATIFLNIIQMCFFIFVFYSSSISSSVVSRNKGFIIKENIQNYGMVKYLPQTFFANSVYDILYLFLCISFTVIVSLMIYFLLSDKYYILLDRVNSLKEKKKFSKPKLNFSFINNIISKYSLTNNYEIASFNLVKYNLLNSRFLRLKYFPVAFMPVLIVLIGMISGLPHLLFFNKDVTGDSFFKTAILVISPSITFTLLMCSRLLISNTKILDENSNDTVWIFNSLPIKDKSFVIKGANKFIYIFFIFPAILIIFILLSFKANISVVAANVLFISSGIYFINSVRLLFDNTFPFSMESSKFNSSGKFIEILFSLLLGVILFLIQIFVFQNIIFVIITIAVFIIVSLLLNRN